MQVKSEMQRVSSLPGYKQRAARAIQGVSYLSTIQRVSNLRKIQYVICS